MTKYRLFFVIAALASGILSPAWAQFFWAEDGLPIRQGLHLGWNGAMIPAGEDVALFYYDCRRDGTRDVWGQRIAPEGIRRWGLDGELVTTHISEQRFPILNSYSDGSILVVWEDYAPGRYRDIFAQRYAADGTPLWSPATGVAVVEAIRDQFSPYAALDENGYAYIIFTDDRETNGINVRLEVYGQVLTPQGQRVCPLDGIHIMDRLWAGNEPWGIVANQGAGYALITGHGTEGKEIIIQKILPSGTIAWPDDPAVAITNCGSPPRIAAIPGGLAIGYTWCDASHEEAFVKCVDLDLNLLPGWNDIGTFLGMGAPHAAVLNMLSMPDSSLKVVSAFYDDTPDRAEVRLATVHRNGQQSGNLEIENVAAETSPVDLVLVHPDTLWLAWTERTEYPDGNTVNRAKLAKNWSPFSLQHVLPASSFFRVNKDVRCDLVKPAIGPARMAIVVGRSVARPESLWVVGLTEQGSFSGMPELYSGGITYDTYDHRIARTGEERLAVVWTDTRDHLVRDVYLQYLDRFGNPLLDLNGKRLTNAEHSIQAPPAILADGSGGAYIAWTSDSLGAASYLNVQRIGPTGELLWPQPLRLLSQRGFYGETLLVTANDGLYAAFTEYSASFVTRTRVVLITSSGQFAWSPERRELSGNVAFDMTLESAVSDNAGGLFLSLPTGSWEDTDITLFHLAEDGTPGTGWPETGLSFGSQNLREAYPKLVMLEDGIVLTYARQIASTALFTIRAVKFDMQAQPMWGLVPRELIGSEPQLFRYDLQPDGTGGFFVAWEDYRATESARLYVSRFSATGGALWTESGVRACTFDDQQQDFAITEDGSGGAWIIWEDARHSDEYAEYDLYATHLDQNGEFATIGGFTWPAEGQPMCDVPTYQREVKLVSWTRGAAVAVWLDQRSSNPGRCCGAGAVGDIFNNIYAQTLSEISLDAQERNEHAIPQEFAITSIYPNPFNSTALIEFNVPTASQVKLAIFNTLGEQVAVLVDRPFLAGTHRVGFDGTSLSSGVYFARLQGVSSQYVKKMLLLK